MNASKSVKLSLVTLLLGTTMLSSITNVQANTLSVDEVTQAQEPPLKVTQDDIRIFVIDGKIYELPADAPTPTKEEIQAMRSERGKWSAAAKAIKAAYHKLPTNIKKQINEYLGIDALLNSIEHYTGWIETGIYETCRNAGMPDWMAWGVAKTLTLLAL